MSAFVGDIRYSLRMLAQSPGFTAVAVLTLALAIGANTAIFSLINALLLKSLPQVKDPRRLVLVTDNGWPNLSYPLYEHLRDHSESLTGLFASPYIDKGRVGIPDAGAAEVELLRNQAVSGNFFSILGVSATLGRMLTSEDDRAGEPQPVVVISHDFWSRRFGRDPAVLGKTITLEDVPLTVVGVAPPGFSGFVPGTRPDLWWPIQLIPQVKGEGYWLTSAGSQWMQIAGRLKPDVSETQAQEELDTIFKQMRLAQVGDRPLSEKERQDILSHRIRLQSAGTGFTWQRREFQRMFFVLMAIVGAVLLIACTNLAGLLLARGAARQREFSVRAALGADRLALVRQLLTESLLLALAGGVLGLLLAQWGVRLLLHYIPEQGETALFELAPDLRILAFTFAVSVGTGLLFGLLPAWRSSRQEVSTALKNQAGSVMGRESGQFWNQALMVAQIALSCCLLIGAGLFVRTLQELRTMDVGFDRESLMVFYLEPGRGYADGNRRADLQQEVLQRVQTLPAVRSAGMSNVQSLGGGELGYGPGKVARAESDPMGDEGMKVRGTAVTLDYFRTMGIPLLMGRDFGPQDEPTASGSPPDQTPRPLIIDQTCARRLFGNENPVGKLVRGDGRPREVIGVVGDVVHKGLRGGPRLSVYSVETCRAWALGFFHVRTGGDPLIVAAAIRQVVREIDPRVQVGGLHTMHEMVNDQVRRERMLAQLGGFFSLSALALCCLGLYGILSYSVTRRTREIGVRMALGAQKRDVLAAVIRQGLTLTLLGGGLGTLLAAGVTRIVSSLLYGVTPTDPLTFALTVLLLGMVALVSCWLPARRAARIDPMAALRYE
ncbi:MAG: ABC transporter permease [Planctomycetes bacterium]|nr:ABC transporter permease [Planctomycetota bacterium]